MRRNGGGRRIVCHLADKVSASTIGLRLFVGVAVVISAVAAMMYAALLGTDTSYIVRNDANVYVLQASDGGSSNSASTSSTHVVQRVLFPQLHASVGLHTVCVGYNCYPRTHLEGLVPLVAEAVSALALHTWPDAVATAYEEATYQYIFGFDVGTPCGTKRTDVLSLGNLAVGAAVLSLMALFAFFAISAALCVLVGDVDVLVGIPMLDRQSHEVKVDVLDLPALYVSQKIRSHLRCERPLLIAAVAVSSFIFLMSVFTMAATLALNQKVSKCGQPVCEAFLSNMERFFTVAAAGVVNVTESHQFSCHYGSSYALSIAGCSLCTMCILMSSAALLSHHYSHRREDLTEMLEQLRRLAKVQGIAEDTLQNEKVSSPLRPRRTSTMMPSLSFMPSAFLASLPGDTSDALHGGSRGGGAEWTRQHFSTAAVGTPPSCDSNLGGRIQMYRLLRQCAAAEQQHRRLVIISQKREFHAEAAVLEAMRFAEELSTLHTRMLDWYIRPLLDMFLLETFDRQQLLREYLVTVGATLAELSSTAVSSVHRETGGLGRLNIGRIFQSGGERARWKALIRRCKKLHTTMSHPFLATASDPVEYAEDGARLHTEDWMQQPASPRGYFEDGSFFHSRLPSALLVRGAHHRFASLSGGLGTPPHSSTLSAVFSSESFVDAECVQEQPPPDVTTSFQRSLQ